MLNYEDILQEVKQIRRVLWNVPDPVFFDGTTKDALAGKVLEALATYGKLESVCYTSHQLIGNLEDRIEDAIRERDEADRRWREKYASDVIGTIVAGPDGDEAKVTKGETE